jgi:hypothetical protein
MTGWVAITDAPVYMRSEGDGAAFLEGPPPSGKTSEDVSVCVSMIYNLAGL